MFVHFDSTAVHVLNVRTEIKPEYQLLKANGRFLNFANEPITIYFDVYVPKNNPDWTATTTFVVDDIIKLTGTITNLEDNTVTVRSYNLYYFLLLPTD